MSEKATGLNHEGEPLHTGDDERIDLVTSIIAAAEELEGDEDVTETAASIIDDCHKLDALLLATIDRERAAVNASAPLVEALKVAVDTIRAFHGIGLSGPSERFAWDLYQKSPEMQQINAALALVADASREQT